MQLTIRQATHHDAATIAKFNIAMARETEDKALPGNVILTGVNRLMDMPDHGFYIVAEDEGRTAGCLMITTEWSDWRNGFFWWIQSVYVLPEYRRKGVYRAMYRHIKSLAAQKPDICGYRLYVEKDNLTARKTYESLGMTATPYTLYEETIS